MANEQPDAWANGEDAMPSNRTASSMIRIFTPQIELKFCACRTLPPPTAGSVALLLP